MTRNNVIQIKGMYMFGADTSYSGLNSHYKTYFRAKDSW